MNPTTPQKKKPVTIWIVLLVLPVALLLLTSIIQIAAQFALNSNDGVDLDTSQSLRLDEDGSMVDEDSVSPITTAANIISVLLGMGSVLMIIVGTPIWVTMLVLAINHNKQLSAGQPQPPASPQSHA